MTKTVKKRSQIQEKSVAKTLNASVVVASGALWGAKGDCRSDKCLIECKTTEKDYYSVTGKVWEKIEEEALKDGLRIPLLIVDLEDKDRVVVFNPMYFNTSVPHPRVEDPKTTNKSFRISLKKFQEVFENFLDYPMAYYFTICGEKINLLCYMRIEDFIENYKEEI